MLYASLQLRFVFVPIFLSVPVQTLLYPVLVNIHVIVQVVCCLPWNPFNT